MSDAHAIATRVAWGIPLLVLMVVAELAGNRQVAVILIAAANCVGYAEGRARCDYHQR